MRKARRRPVGGKDPQNMGGKRGGGSIWGSGEGEKDEVGGWFREIGVNGSQNWGDFG